MNTFYTPPPGTRTAASLLLLRDGPTGLEVLMVRRAERAGDAQSSAAVFPGGLLDVRDRAAHAHCLGADDATVSARLGVAEGGLDFMVAALRETFEEVGLLFADGRIDAAAWQQWRGRLQAGEVGAADFCAATGLRLDLRGLAYFSHWLTPPGAPKRFDTRFFAALAPAGQVAEPDGGETAALMWLTPAQALDKARALKLLPVTSRTLQELAAWPSADAAMQAIGQRGPIALTMPRRALSARGPGVVMPEDAPYAEVGRLDPDGRGDAHAVLEPGRAVRLSDRVLRVTAPNPGPMTGPGTNSYLVGSEAGWTVIDPGPASDAHLQALLAAAAGAPILRILVTHTHRDHSPGAVALAAATGAPVWGRRAAHPHGQDESFAPQREPAHGERILAGDGATLRVVHTPGHASNHLCFLLEQERLLFTGDHVMQGSTVVINPPDGDMAVYLRALHALLDEDLQWLAPGHGFLVGDPHAVVRALIAHRGRREAKVLRALQRAGPAPLDGLLTGAYDDVPPHLHGIAKRSLLAHLLKLQADGAARLDAEAWSAL